ncbi:hypothetical protein ACR77J_06510 [Tissierella praeacuta]|uniref:hypothetical protein n=1 Tax=Tissierella praeacuta TaxID=43131 RepID=UPI003DA3DC86
MLIYLMLKSLLRNKWNMVKLFLISPVNAVLPVILLSGVIGTNIDKTIILKICLWSCFYFTIFEIISRRMEFFGSEKIQDVLLSRISLHKYNFYQTVAVNILYIPSLLITLYLYDFIFHLNIDFIFAIICAFFVFINNVIVSNIMLAVHLKTQNYFNRFNFGMDIIYIISGVLYPISILPRFLRGVSHLIPITHVISFSEGNVSHIEIAIFVFLIMMAFALWNTEKSIKKYILSGGFYG